MKWIYPAAISLALFAQAGCAGLSRAPLNVQAFGATGDGKTKDTAAFQKALDACAAASGGTVIVPAGSYLIGSIELKSHTALRLEKGANLLGSPNLEDYPIVKVRWEGKWIDGHRALIFAHDANHIAIIGGGNISGNPALGGRQMPRRPVIIEPINCTDVLFEGFSTEHHEHVVNPPRLLRKCSCEKSLHPQHRRQRRRY